MSVKSKSFGTVLLQLALGLLFIVNGIWTIQGARGDEIAAAIFSVFSYDVANIICLVYGIIEIVAGIFLLLRLIVDLNTNLDNLLILIIMIFWIATIIITDFIGNKSLLNNLDKNILPFLNTFARHLLTLGAIIKIKG